jgi:hypothetical protein
MPPPGPRVNPLKNHGTERPPVENYFNYFTEIEEHFHRRRGGILLLSTLDWALIESWKDAGIPLEAVLRGIDATFDHWERRPSKARKVNGLGFCAQEVLVAAEDMKEAAVGAERSITHQGELPRAEVAAYLSRNADRLQRAPEGSGGPVKALPPSAVPVADEVAGGLRGLAAAVVAPEGASNLFEEIERRLTVMEQKLFAALLASTPDEAVVGMRAEAERELAPYRRKMPGMQIEQLMQQFVRKRLLEQHGIPRLSLFYM